MSRHNILVTGASSGFGRLSAEALALSGHTVYASMRDTNGRNAPQVAAISQFRQDNDCDLRTVDMDVQSQDSVDAAIDTVVGECGRVDVVLHNAGHMVFGPAEAFTPDQLAALYDVNVVGTQRVNRAVLPHLRRQKQGLLLWMSSSSCAGGTPPYLAPYFAAKVAMDSLAVTYSRELVRWGIETSIIVPGAFTSGTNHFAHAGAPEDQRIADEYDNGPYAGFGPQVQTAFNAIVPDDADVAAVARAVVDVVNTPFGKRPFRVHIDPSEDGANVGFAVLDRLKAEMLHRVGLADLLHPATRSFASARQGDQTSE